MADSNRKSDPTVSSSSTTSNVEKGRSGTEQPHPAVPVSEGADAADNQEFKDNPDKPDPTTIAQVEVQD
jgi:hypothetical protein